MDNSCPLILEISSDEESGFLDIKEGDFTGDGGGFGDREDHNWLSKLLGEVDGDKDDDSDEVLLVSEMIPNPKKPRLQSWKPAWEIVCGGGDEDDDDCVILECESDQARVVKNDGVDNLGGGGGGGSGDSDDLEIVGEKGEVACRDFPHARHLCANFAFASTPHDVHCSQCHCYVCDSLAPCAHWGTGISKSDHCHASDKEDYWKTERIRAKNRDQPLRALPGTIDAFFSAGHRQTSQVPALLQPLANSLLQNQAFRQVPFRPCFKSSTVNVPIAINQNGSHLAGRVIPRYKTHPQYSPQQLHTMRSKDATTIGNSSNPMNRGHPIVHRPTFKGPGFVEALPNSSNPMNRGPPIVHRPTFKGPGFVEALPNSRHGHDRRYYRSQVSRGSLLKRCPGLNNGNSFNHPQNTVHRAAHPVLPQPNFPVPQSINVGSVNYIHSDPQVHSKPNSSHVVGGSMHSQPDTPSQSYMGDNFENGITFHSQVLSQPNLEVHEVSVPPLLDKIFQPNFPASSQRLLSKQLDSSNEHGKQIHSTPVIPSPLNQSPQFPEFGEHTTLCINPQNNYHENSQSQGVKNTIHADFGVNWNTSLSRNDVLISSEISQLQSATSADNTQRPSMTENDCSIVPPDSFYPQSVPPGSGQLLGADNDSHFPVGQDPNSLNFSFDNWIMENPSFPGDLEVSPMSPGLSVFSPEPASIDAGTLFDF
ncbi:uncharacterized protein [Henckelia pumila]|uniref:uncharacterized protein isoform X2 n=1 Tax=Henckelia pumila TaxID=405737 RepID=UPI003C6DBA5E